MKKSQILITSFFALAIPLSVNASDIDAGIAYDMGFGATVLINEQVNLMLGNKGIAADFYLQKGTFDANVPFTWYIAGGGYHKWNDGFGARLPLGLNINFQNNQQNWNAYTQIAPSFGVDGDSEAKFDAQFSLGIRYSF
jgi:hypothetical protein